MHIKLKLRKEDREQKEEADRSIAIRKVQPAEQARFWFGKLSILIWSTFVEQKVQKPSIIAISCIFTVAASTLKLLKLRICFH